MRTLFGACGANVVSECYKNIVFFHARAFVRVDFGPDLGVKLLPVTGSSAGGKLTPSN